jgi:ParB family transcriptional regulator, chromosome partitioning protein
MINATMNIRMVPLHQIRPYENNVKQHPIKQLESIVQSIKTFGFRQPIVIDANNVIVCGHARYEAAAAIGMGDVPCEIASDLSKEQINAYRILDNEIAAKGYTDQDALKIEIASIPEFDFVPFDIDLNKISIDIKEPAFKEDKLIECPNCTYKFKKNEVVNG